MPIDHTKSSAFTADVTKNSAVKVPATINAKNRKKLGVIWIIVTATVVLGGGTALAYYGVIVPNEPKNVIKKAVTNTLSQKKTKFDNQSFGMNGALSQPPAESSPSDDSSQQCLQALQDYTSSGGTKPIPGCL